MTARRSRAPAPATRVARLPITIAADVVVCAATSARFALAAGLSRPASRELAIAVSELATNVLKFAGSGSLTLESCGTEPAAVEIVVQDSGPGIPDLEAAMEDGWSEGYRSLEAPVGTLRRGLGTGLGAVRRMMDSVRVERTAGGGLRITARKARPATRAR